MEVSTSLEEEEDLDIIQPITGTLDAVSSGNVLFVKGEFKTELVFECSRCLTPVQVAVKFKVDEEFPVEGTPAGYGNRDYAEVKEEAEPSPLFDGNQLRYEDLLRQDLWLALPMRVLCREACEGIPEAQTVEEHGRPELKKLAQLLEEDKEAG